MVCILQNHIHKAKQYVVKNLAFTVLYFMLILFISSEFIIKI